MNITGISFSYAENSLQTRGLQLLSKNVPINVYSMLDFDMPICNSNKSDGNVPNSVIAFDKVLKDADILIFAISEATGHYCVGFKNAMDWLVVKSKFNARLGTDYTITDKPIFVITFTPTVYSAAMNGARHFEMTTHLLKKLGSNVIDQFVVHDSWRTIIPNNEQHLESISIKIKDYAENYILKEKKEPIADISTSSWLELYNNWDKKWKE